MISNEQAAAMGWTPRGTSDTGNQVFSLSDLAGVQKNWIVDDTGNAVFLPDGALKTRTGAPLISLDYAEEIGWTPNGYDAAGNQLFFIIDAAGTRKNWFIDAAGVAQFLADGTGASPMTPTAPPVPNIPNLPPTPPPSFPANVQPPPPNNPLVPTNQNPPANPISPLFDPVPKFVGYDVAGRQVFTQIDQAGNTVEYSRDANGNAIGTHYLTGGYASPSLVVSQTPPANRPTPNGPQSGAGSKKTWLLLGGAVALVYLLNRKKTA